MTLIKKLTKIGNSLGVILPTDILKVVGITEKSEVEISVKEDEIVLRPTDLKDHKVMTSVARFIKKYRHDLKKLAS